MNITSYELREIHLPLVHFFETSFSRTYDRRIILVRALDADGAEGWGECTVGENPFYSEEWTEGAWNVIKEYLVPMTLGIEFATAADFFDLMRPVRGNRMAKAALETAIWDLEARRANLPLWRHLGGTQPEIAAGVSIGIQDTFAELVAAIEKELSAGYQRIKIKIKPGWDAEIVAGLRERFPQIPLMVDANSAYTLNEIEMLRALDAYHLMMIEQPLAHDDISDHAVLQRQIATPICLDESIRTPEDARHAIEAGACRIINIKLGRIGGHREARRAEVFARERGVPVWCGGMLESGIGRAHNIAMSTLAGFTLPGDVSASARYWHEDIIEPPVTISARGTIAVPASVGIGYEISRARIDALTVRRELFSHAASAKPL